jgi:protein ImuB
MARFVAVFSKDLAPALALAQVHSPRVEAHPPDRVLLEISEREEPRIYSQILKTLKQPFRLAVASTRTAALLAVNQADPAIIVPCGEEREFLAPLPIQMLSLLGMPIKRELLITLGNWGVQTVGELAALPDKELVARLGPGILDLQKTARGEDCSLFQPFIPEISFEETQELDFTLFTLEPLNFILGSLLERIGDRLSETGQAAESVCLDLKLEDGSRYHRKLRLAYPIRDSKVISSLLRLDLQSRPPTAGIVGLHLKVCPVPPRVFQHALFQPTVPNPEKLTRTLARLSALVGEDNLGSPVVLDTYRPDGYRLQPFAFEGKQETERAKAPSPFKALPLLVLRRFRPPVPARVQKAEVAAWTGPWKSSGEWWMESSWTRDEWDIEFKNGTICRFYWNPEDRKWFLEGIYD